MRFFTSFCTCPLAHFLCPLVCVLITWDISLTSIPQLQHPEQIPKIALSKAAQVQEASWLPYSVLNRLIHLLCRAN